MINFLLYKTIESANITDLTTLILYATDVVPILPILILILIFLTTTSATYFSSKRLTGTANIFNSFVVGSILATIVSVFMLLIPNLISVYVVSILITISIILIAILFLINQD